jgi:orotidine-5'-phosphate decarboxylase
MNNKNIFVACDTSKLNQIKRIIKNTKTNELNIIPKFGLQFFYSKHGRKLTTYTKRLYLLWIVCLI